MALAEAIGQSESGSPEASTPKTTTATPQATLSEEPPRPQTVEESPEDVARRQLQRSRGTE